jgi:glycosyltransferase involved in cell wall biosynthesis
VNDATESVRSADVYAHAFGAFMNSSQTAENEQPSIWALCPLPPPVTGMTLLTEKVVQRLREKATVRLATWTAGDARQRPRTRVLRVLRAANCLIKLVLHGSVRNTRLYLTANSKGGLIMTGLIVMAARRLGYVIYLHHHAYNYIDQYDKKMAWIDRSMGPEDVHLVHCPQMIEDFRARYPSKSRFECLYPSIVSLPLAQPRSQMPRQFCLGFLANLSVAKGLDLVLETFQVLRQRGRNVRLCLAGPCSTAEAERMLEDALQKHKPFISHVGGVYGERKIEYFNSIDCFVFPTKYDCESWGIVLNEALASGLPIITTDRGCIRTLMGTGAGEIINDESTFVADAVRQIETWIDSPETFAAASHAAIQQADCLHRHAAEQLEQLAARICSPVQSTSD